MLWDIYSVPLYQYNMLQIFVAWLLQWYEIQNLLYLCFQDFVLVAENLQKIIFPLKYYPHLMIE